MRNENRTFKNENKIKATVKAYTVYAKQELIAGKLDRRGVASKLIANVKPVKIIEIGQRLDLRIAYRKFNGNTLAYCHGFGWIEIDDLNAVFETRNGQPIKDDLYEAEYQALSIQEKINLIKDNFELNELTKTEQLLIAYLDGKDLKEAVNEIGIDKSMQYKIKKDPNKYMQSFIKKFENQLA